MPSPEKDFEFSDTNRPDQGSQTDRPEIPDLPQTVLDHIKPEDLRGIRRKVANPYPKDFDPFTSGKKQKKDGVN